MTIWLYTSALTTALQTYALLWYCARLFRQRLPLPQHWAWKAGVFLLADGAVCFAIYLLTMLVPRGNMSYAFGCTVLVQFAACAILFAGDGFYKGFTLLFANVYFTGVLMVARFAKDALLPPGALPTPMLYSLFVNILPQCVAIVALIPLCRRAAKVDFFLSPPRFYWLFGYCVELALYFGMIYTTAALLRWDLVSGLSVVLEAVLLAVCVAFYLLFLSVCGSYQEKVQHTLIRRQYELQKAQFSEIQASNQALRELRHELKNYMFYMNYLIDQGDFDKLKQFFAEFYQKEHHNLYEVSGSDSFLDAVLQQKIARARSLSIEVTPHILLPADEALDNLDLCVVLSNLIDNAMEACRELPASRIEIRLKRVKEYLSVVVENTASGDVLRDNPQLRTSKGDKALHGIGLKVIRQIVERYDGSIEFQSDDAAFKVMLMMKLPAQAKGGNAA